MLTSTVCEEFDSLREKFPDELDDPVKYMSTSGTLKQHCPDRECKTYNNIVNGGFLWLLDTFYDGKSVFSYYADGKIDIVVYIMMWLGYKLNHKLNTQFSNINEFYNTHMKNYYGYAKKIDYVDDYNSYNDLINKHNYVFNIPNEHMSKFYDAFKSLCKLYTECDNIESDYNSYLEKTQEFVKKYEQLKDLDINKNESYGKLFSILSNDYDNLKNKLFIIWISETISKTKIKSKNKKYNEENDSLIYNSKSSDYFRNSNNVKLIIYATINLNYTMPIEIFIKYRSRFNNNTYKRCFMHLTFLIYVYYPFNFRLYIVSFYVKVLNSNNINRINILHLKSLKDKI
ncbi:hypothetical protein YYC_02114 [Plasmodium yoelii 17X]|uniref:Uncharacterized protein n=1 Tax=Plasmodium yoelii 17X TaxID=1323249 RepID=V7PN54_PLAYE|nr:hypothetical protein YYC_02114 [Plasmodium yoelii 17X]